MSIRSSVRSLVIVILSLGTKGLAFARTPPALVESQKASTHAGAGPGYRDSLARVSAARRAEGALPSAGYRDALTRFAVKKVPVRVVAR